MSGLWSEQAACLDREVAHLERLIARDALRSPQVRRQPAPAPLPERMPPPGLGHGGE
jgi:hypothetical protein